MEFYYKLSVAILLLGTSLPAKAQQQIPEDLNQARDFMLVKSEIVNRLGPDYREDYFRFDESRLDREVLRSEYLYAKQKMLNPYQYPTIGQLFFKKNDLYDYIFRKFRDHEHWVGYASKFMHKFNIREYDTFVNFSNRPFSQLFGEFLEHERIEAKKWHEIDKVVRSNPHNYLLQGPHHPHKVTGVDKLHNLGINGTGAEAIVWDCGFVDNCHVNFSIKDNHVAHPETPHDYDRNQLHGTHVSGIIAANEQAENYRGVAYNASILPVDFNGVDEFFNRIQHSKAKVVSASFHYLVDRLDIRDFDRLAAELEKNDRILVMASGNSSQYMNDELNPNFLTYWARGIWMGKNSSWIFNKNPNLAKRIIFVGSLKEDGQTVSYFSNLPGNMTDSFVFAPGENVISTVAFDNFDKMSGTSMATPHVSGILTLLSKYYPTLNALELKDCLLNSCDRFWEDLSAERRVDYKPEIFGKGRVNAVKAFELGEAMSKSKLQNDMNQITSSIDSLGLGNDSQMIVETGYHINSMSIE